MRHKMLNITYDWDTEQARINYSSHFKAYDPLEMMDSLQDVMSLLEEKYEEARKQFRLRCLASHYNKNRSKENE